jgi:hypothetical protein
MAGGNARVLADHREGETGVKVLDALEVGNLLVREADREGTDVALERDDRRVFRRQAGRRLQQECGAQVSRRAGKQAVFDWL